MALALRDNENPAPGGCFQTACTRAGGALTCSTFTAELRHTGHHRACPHPTPCLCELTRLDQDPIIPCSFLLAHTPDELMIWLIPVCP